MKRERMGLSQWTLGLRLGTLGLFFGAPGLLLGALCLFLGPTGVGAPSPAQAMSLFMGEEPQEPATPVQPVVAKPLAVPGSPAPVANAPTPAPVQPVVAKPPAASGGPPPVGVHAPPAAGATDVYTYDPKGRREPFQSLAGLFKSDKTRAELPPLQRMPLSDLKLTGIMWGGYGYYGLIRTPDGKGYTVKEGTLVGTNHGVISKITDQVVIVSEPGIDIAGNKITKDVEILLRPKEVNQ